MYAYKKKVTIIAYSHLLLTHRYVTSHFMRFLLQGYQEVSVMCLLIHDLHCKNKIIEYIAMQKYLQST